MTSKEVNRKRKTGDRIQELAATTEDGDSDYDDRKEASEMHRQQRKRRRIKQPEDRTWYDTFKDTKAELAQQKVVSDLLHAEIGKRARHEAELEAEVKRLRQQLDNQEAVREQMETFIATSHDYSVRLHTQYVLLHRQCMADGFLDDEPSSSLRSGSMDPSPSLRPASMDPSGQ